MIIKVRKIRPDVHLPERASNQAVGYDVFASCVLDKITKKPIGGLPVEIPPGGSVLIGIGVQFAIPWPCQCEVRPRSGLASKYDIELSNSPGTIDPDFRGEAGVLLRNRGEESFVVEPGMRIAQLIFSEVKIPILEEADELPPTTRGAGGFGSTGLFGIKEGTEEFRREIENRDRFYMTVVLAISERSNCVRGVPKDANGNYLRDESGKFVGQTRKFGCVVVKGDNIIAMGYNAQHKGSPLCSEVGCLRETENIPSGTKLERCRAIHAEWMALSNLVTSGVGASTKGATMYLNAEPCEICAKLIAQTEMEALVLMRGVYPTNGTNIVREAGIEVRYIEV